MTDYKSMYYKLFNRVSDAIEVLQLAQQESEKMFIENKSNEALKAALDDESQ
jgi:hypothetical protein